MGGGAWPFLVGGVICLLNCVNERDTYLLTRSALIRVPLLRETTYTSTGKVCVITGL